ncbi:MAG: alanine racemase [Campylobacterota bacterium]|nr:alanine racemase [Campylobacterota bacterium]
MAYITISRENFYHNLDQLVEKVGSIDKVAIVLKDNAYGHGLMLMAKLAHEYGIKHTVVKNMHEALQIKELFQSVLILGDQAIEDKKLYFAINSISALEKIENKAQIELKLDTGMHRNGIALEEIDRAIDIIESKNLNLKGVMTHYKSADELSSELFWQQKNFQDAINHLRKRGVDNFRVHACNSAATLRQNYYCNENLVRIGISAYGYNELADVFDKVKLKPILSLYASKVSSLALSKGSRVGYGGEGVLVQDEVVSTYDIGYGDGWLRATKNMFIDNKTKTIGRVSMDFISLNSDKDEVCIMSDAQKVANYCNTISYEILVRLSESIERVISKE